MQAIEQIHRLPKSEQSSEVVNLDLPPNVQSSSARLLKSGLPTFPKDKGKLTFPIFDQPVRSDILNHSPLVIVLSSEIILSHDVADGPSTISSLSSPTSPDHWCSIILFPPPWGLSSWPLPHYKAKPRPEMLYSRPFQTSAGHSGSGVTFLVLKDSRNMFQNYISFVLLSFISISH